MTGVLADSHLHLFSRGFPGRSGRSVLGRDPEIEAYEAFRSVHGIAAGLVVGYEADGIDPDNNRYIRSLAAERPWLATLAYLDPRAAPAAAAVAALLDHGHVGIAVYLPDAKASAAMVAWPVETWRVLQDHRAIVSLDARHEAIGDLLPLVRRQTACTFLFSHLGLPGRHTTIPGAAQAAERLAPLLRLADLPHAMVKISGLYAVSDPPHCYPHAAAIPFIDLLLDRFRPARCIWGSDFSPALEFVSFAQTVSHPALDRLAGGARDQVMGANLLRLLGREGGGEGGGDP